MMKLRKQQQQTEDDDGEEHVRRVKQDELPMCVAVDLRFPCAFVGVACSLDRSIDRSLCLPVSGCLGRASLADRPAVRALSLSVCNAMRHSATGTRRRSTSTRCCTRTSSSPRTFTSYSASLACRSPNALAWASSPCAYSCVSLTHSHSLLLRHLATSRRTTKLWMRSTTASTTPVRPNARSWMYHSRRKTSSRLTGGVSMVFDRAAVAWHCAHSIDVLLSPAQVLPHAPHDEADARAAQAHGASSSLPGMSCYMRANHQ